MGPSYREVWPSIAGFWDLQTTSFEDPMIQFKDLGVSKK